MCFRPTWEGGRYNGDESKRREALRLAMELGADYIDVELKVEDPKCYTVYNHFLIVIGHLTEICCANCSVPIGNIEFAS